MVFNDPASLGSTILKLWITSGIITAIRKRDYLSKKLIKSPHDINLKNEYIFYRNSINKLIKTVKNSYYKAKFIETNGNIKDTWRTINEITNQTKQPIIEINIKASGENIGNTLIIR